MKEELHEIHEHFDKLANLEPYVDDEDNDDNDIDDNAEELLKVVRTPLFKDNPTNRLQVVLMLLNICTIFGVPNACVDELLKLLKHDLFPKENICLPSHYEAKKW